MALTLRPLPLCGALRQRLSAAHEDVRGRALTRARPAVIGLALVLFAGLQGCANYQVNLRPLRGVPLEHAALLRNGEVGVSPDSLFEAAASALEHEPYLHWDIQTLDRSDGFLKATAGFMREVQIRVSKAEDGNSRLSVSVPRRALKTRAKIWVKRDEPSQRTAYEPQPHRHLHIRTFEIHPVEDVITLMRHLGPKHRHAAGGRRQQTHNHRDGGGLAGAVAAQKSGDRAVRDFKRNTVHGRHLLVDLDEALDFYGRRSGHARADVACADDGGKGRTHGCPAGAGMEPLYRRWQNDA